MSQQLDELIARAVQPALDAPEWHVQDIRDLRVAESLEIPEHEEAAIFGPKGDEFVFESLLALPAL
jgi:hypothetical protein